MKLCFVCGEYPPAAHGGIGSVTRVLGRALVERGHEVRVAGLYPEQNLEGGRIPAFEDDGGVKVWRFPIPKKRFGWVGARWSLYRLVAGWARRGEIDLVEVPDWEGLSAGWPSIGVPVIARLHGSSSYFSAEIGTQHKKSTFLLERAALRRSDYSCSVSRYTAEKTRTLFSITGPPAEIIYNGVHVAVPTPWTERSRTDVIFSGTLTAKKGIISLIRAWHRVVEAHPSARLRVFGKDTPRAGGSSMLEFLRGELPAAVRSTVSFHGHTHRDQLLTELARARVAVFPSYAEAFAMAPLEAMAAGCPTVYSLRGSGPELIEEGVDGLLVEPGDPEQIAASINRVLADDRLAQRLGEAGRKKIQQRFSAADFLKVNEEFYAGCVERFRRRMN
jgi:glycogen synthase